MTKAGEQPKITQSLKPCPFCGGRAIGTRTLAGVEWWSVECVTCTARVDDPNSKQDAAKVWNTRTPSLAAQDGLVDALEGLQKAEADYRLAHDVHGSGDMRCGRAWDKMRRAGDKARAALSAKGDKS